MMWTVPLPVLFSHKAKDRVLNDQLGFGAIFLCSLSPGMHGSVLNCFSSIQCFQSINFLESCSANSFLIEFMRCKHFHVVLGLFLYFNLVTMNAQKEYSSLS